MNPVGFLFGPNAMVNVAGMVAFTTADYLRFQGTDTLFNNESTPESLSPVSISPGGSLRLSLLQPGGICHSGQHAPGYAWNAPNVQGGGDEKVYMAYCGLAIASNGLH
jgi:hypothetical protein